MIFEMGTPAKDVFRLYPLDHPFRYRYRRRNPWMGTNEE
jgi:hypothetical protein